MSRNWRFVLWPWVLPILLFGALKILIGSELYPRRDYLRLEVAATNAFALIRSTNLIDWEILMTTTNEGAHRFTIHYPREHPMEFYRLAPVYVGGIPVAP